MRAWAAAVFAVALPAAAGTWTAPRVPDGARAPAPLESFSALACAGCHAEIAAEWAASTHAKAWTDPQFQAERKKDPAVAWLCDNCHTPLARQQAELSVDTGNPRAPVRRPNPDFDAALRDEGVTCLTCHWRPGGLAGVNPDSRAPHPVVHDPTLRSEKTCTPCHQAEARVEAALVCAFDTGVSWQAAGEQKTCPECHMPRVVRPMAAGGPVREGGRHLFLGSLMPKGPQTPEEAAIVASAQWQPGVALEVGGPLKAPVGAEVRLSVALRHDGAGHDVPTGDPERFLMLEGEVVAADGRVLTQLRERIGQVWTWWPEARRLSDNRLRPGETRRFSLRFKQLTGGVEVRLRLTHHRITAENAARHALGGYPRMREVASRIFRVESEGSDAKIH